MVRRIAQQVHKQLSRLMRAEYINPSAEPVWYKAVLEHPPLPLPPKAPPSRTTYDLPPKTQPTMLLDAQLAPKLRTPQNQPLPIHYIEDDVRRQFFRDHPFESFRAISLVEDAEIEEPHPISGKCWTRLRQRGRNPSSDDVIRFVINLYGYHNHSLSSAYTAAIAQFRSLRAEHHYSTIFATLEAEHFGAEFGPSEIEHSFQKEMKGLDTWERREELDEGAIASRKRWKVVFERKHGIGQWSKGEEYVKLWKEGLRPTYIPALTDPVPTNTPSPGR